MRLSMHLELGSKVADLQMFWAQVSECRQEHSAPPSRSYEVTARSPLVAPGKTHTLRKQIA